MQGLPYSSALYIQDTGYSRCFPSSSWFLNRFLSSSRWSVSQTYHFGELSGRAEVGSVWAGVWAGGVLETSRSVGPEWRARQQGSPGWEGGDNAE